MSETARITEARGMLADGIDEEKQRAIADKLGAEIRKKRDGTWNVE